MIQIQLSDDTEARLRERAASAEDVSAYAARLLREALRTPSADQLLAPFRRQIADSGMSDQQLDVLFESLREEVWREQQGKKAGSA